MSATCFSSSRSDHRERPAGGCEHASAISLASTSPVTTEGTGGNSRSFRPTVTQTSPSVSANRFETKRTVSHETPTRSAITARGSTPPTDVSSASSTRARLIIDALRTPVVVTRTSASRSSTLSATGYFFCDGMTILSGRGERQSAKPYTPPIRTKVSGDGLLVVVRGENGRDRRVPAGQLQRVLRKLGQRFPMAGGGRGQRFSFDDLAAAHELPQQYPVLGTGIRRLRGHHLGHRRPLGVVGADRPLPPAAARLADRALGDRAQRARALAVVGSGDPLVNQSRGA